MMTMGAWVEPGGNGTAESAADRDDELQFHLVSFEGPDGYSRAGGLASRVVGLTETLAARDLETHLWFVGDPGLPGEETAGRLRLHRWCQWISAHHLGGVYEGEEGKRNDFVASLPPALVQSVMLPHLSRGGRAVIMAEEWHTADAVLHLDWLLRRAGIRNRVTILWNANNLFGFHRIDWAALTRAATITTVSRYMKHLLRRWGVDPVVIPNGLPGDTFKPPAAAPLAQLGERTRGRMMVTKIARFDPDKGWLATIDIVRELRREGLSPLLVARGGAEAHGAEVLAAASAAGLRVVERAADRAGVDAFVDALSDVDDADMVHLRSPIDSESRRVLMRAAAAVLANSRHEPFGLVGLETMAAGGLACTGYSGEDYVVPGRNAVVLQTEDPREFVAIMRRLRANPPEERAMRRAGRLTARQYAWSEVVARALLPRLGLLSPS
jgi:glycosyltransferase involved in cell wall biosynthesis